MYPILRTVSAVLRARRSAPLDVTGTDCLPMRVWPNDLDGFMELNNGRILTLFDIGRFTLAVRIGLLRQLRARGWAFAVAGSFIRYRHRVTLFQRLEMRTRVVGQDGRFVLMEQAFWRGDTCTAHLLIRTAVTSKSGVVDPVEVMAALGIAPQDVPQAPDWARDLMVAEAERPWPPSF